MWLNHNVNEQLDVHQANPLCHRLQKTKKKEQQQLTPGPNGKIEEKNIVDSYTSENST